MSAVALVTGAALLLLTLDASLHHAGDDLARGRVHDLAARGARRHGCRPVLASIGGESVAQVFGADGRVLTASPNIVGAPPITGPARTCDARACACCTALRTTTEARTTGSGSPAPHSRTDP